ncbi:MAG: type I-C CRISPR-associated protein Cas7/Csd2 [Planctomycetes bacterium GWF2_41_51]|nr:MAG: type I-C CRISPR-associated protein Cas7/Csd2 [Planctomycetes bacterium GWF2_41_51]HBG27721.1 type I-C CRISPR-associated protein Cas7/Csd2 [Phycisphaerales bacterium]
MNTEIKNRYDFVYLFDVKDGNPNGDPDQANLPRADAENQQGLVTDVCIKRKVRNYIQTKYEDDKSAKYGIFIRQRSIDEQYPFLNKEIENAGDALQDKKKTLLEQYFDIRAFGAVLSTGKESIAATEDGDEGEKEKGKGKTKGKKTKGAGTVRGPVQLTFGRSIDPIYQAEHSITRCVITDEKKYDELKEKMEFPSTFGRKSTVPYGLYRMHGFISAVDAKKTGFSEADLELLWESLLNAFENDRAAARGEMRPRKLVVFKHSSHLGNARSGELFDLVKVESSKDAQKPARSFTDYMLTIPKQSDMPQGVEVQVKL